MSGNVQSRGRSFRRFRRKHLQQRLSYSQPYSQPGPAKRIKDPIRSGPDDRQAGGRAARNIFSPIP
jgi:hypothetical protein